MLEQLHTHAENIRRELEGKRIGILHATTADAAKIVETTRTDIATTLDTLALDISDIPYFPEAREALEELIRGISSVNFICKIVHGRLNRSGLLQGLCEALKRPYTGHDLKTDLVSQNKLVVKSMMREGNIRTPRYAKITPGKYQGLEAFIKRTRASKFVLKPTETNSSIGILFAESLDVLRQMVHELPVQFGDYFVEEFMPGRIITIGVIPLDEDKVYTTPPLEYVLEHGKPIMDHTWKQRPNRVAPAMIPQDVYKKASQWARYLHRAVGAKGITRSDFIIKDGDLFALEINTNVGLAKTNDVPTAAIAGGECYEDIVLANLSTAFLKSNTP